jgi:hypothetical protein
VFNQGVGPKAIPVGDFSLDRLVKALEFMAQPEVGLSCLSASSVSPSVLLLQCGLPAEGN